MNFKGNVIIKIIYTLPKMNEKKIIKPNKRVSKRLSKGEKKFTNNNSYNS